MVSTWERWVDKAPIQWKEDGFLIENVPLAVSCRYGQNRLISKGMEDDDAWKRSMAKAFKKERRYDMVRFVSFALATDIG